ncbi:MAG: methyl-accepting chemotaxis protein [Treponema sp.]|nr:methyl-accepting chemotaxis protein [Treponema sp.]
MKIKTKLSILVIVIMALMVAGISVLLLRKASVISVDLSKRGIKYLAEQHAEYWKGREDGYIRVLRTLANVMREYEDIEPEARRHRFDAMLKGVLASEPNMIDLYTVWNPNALDGMDAHYTDRTGSGPDGQYATAYTRESGDIFSCTAADIEDSMAYINGPNSKKDRVEHPFTKDINGKNTQLIRMMVPIINPRTNETVGGVGCLLVIKAMQPLVEQTMQEHEEISAMVIYAGNGVVLAGERPERIGKLLIDADIEYGNAIEEAHQAVLERKEFTTNQHVPRLGVTLEIAMIPFNIGNSDNGWTIMIASAESYILADVKAMAKYTIVLALIALAAAAVIVFIALRVITKPIVTVTNTLRDISEGEGDLTQTIPEKGNDEITELSRYFNRTLAKIRNLVVTIKEQTVELFNTGNELTVNMTETASAINEITANIRNIKGRVTNQSASVGQTNATMGQISTNIDKLDQYIEHQTSSVSQSSSAVEEMLANINSVTQTLVKNGKSVNELSAASEVGRMDLQKVAEDILEIAKDSQGLLEINRVMKNIAAQTNLLSVNAAIEAAHAGEAGKGFAVVAGEICKLAESSSMQSETISTILKKIKASIDEISESAGAVLARFEAIDSSVKTVSVQEANIRDAMEEQNQGSKQILEAISNLNDITRQVKGGSTEMLEGSREIIQESKNLEMTTEEISGGMNEMAIGAEQINAAVTRVNEICALNKQNIDLLVQGVSLFKVE